MIQAILGVLASFILSQFGLFLAGWPGMILVCVCTFVGYGFGLYAHLEKDF